MLYSDLIMELLAKYSHDDDLAHGRTNLIARIGNGYARFIATCREDVIGAYANGYPVADIAENSGARESKSGAVAPENLHYFANGPINVQLPSGHWTNRDKDLDRKVTLCVRAHVPAIHPAACERLTDSIVAYARIGGLLARNAPKNGPEYNARKSGIAACEQRAMDALATLSELDADMWHVWCKDEGKAYLNGPEAALLDIDGHGQTTGSVDKGDSARIRNDETAEAFTKNGRSEQSGAIPTGSFSTRDFAAMMSGE